MVTEFKFPDLGEGIAEGEVRKWLVKEGDMVKQDQPIAEVETDKAVVEIPSPVPGRIMRLHRPEGGIVKVGEVLVTIDGEKEETAEAPTVKKPSVSVIGELPEAPEVEKTEAAVEVVKPGEVAVKVLATPAVRKLAKELGIELNALKGTGPEGRITEEDVRQFKPLPAEAPKVKVQPKFDFYGYIERQPIRGIRRTTAKRMVESQKRAAHVTSMDIADVTELVALREKEKVALQEMRRVKLTYMPFVIKAVVEALKSNPVLNSTFDEESGEIILKKYYNVGFAVATEDGLIVPIVKGADQKGIVDLAGEVQRLTELADSRKVDLGDLKGGTFTITNYGVFGGTYGTPIINYPEAAILGTGKIMDMPMVTDGEIKIRKVMHLSLSFDHRIMDGAEAARFMNDLKKYLEDPELLLLSGTGYTAST